MQSEQSPQRQSLAEVLSLSVSDHSGTANSDVDSPRPRAGFLRSGWDDLQEGLRRWRIWYLMGSAEIRRRHARSRLGQFWLTLSTSLFIVLYGVVFSLLFRQPLHDLMSYIAISYIFWTFLSGTISGAFYCFIESKAYYINQYASFSISVYALIYKNLIVLLYNSVIIVAVLVYFGGLLRVHLIDFCLGFAITLFTLTWVCYVAGIICARYRDLIQIFQAVLQAAFFVTPVFWKVDMFPEGYRHLLVLNPFSVFLALLRDPLVGESLHASQILVAMLISAVGFVLALVFIGKYHRRIIFWI
jgi:homopolymeric O-antigen transport system permease protein